ncbi:MAG: hypothetical protein NWS37_00175 [Flavobacteriaceae bacterium]|nr:hypothetical protein [Flavobacteriaceae bacterium]
MKSKNKKTIQKLVPSAISHEFQNSPKLKKLASRLEHYAKQVCHWKEQCSAETKEASKKGIDPENEFLNPSE